MKTSLSLMGQLILFLLFGITLSTSVQAEIYKWTDSEGRVHYTQTPPPSGDAEVLNPKYKSNKTPSEVELEFIQKNYQIYKRSELDRLKKQITEEKKQQKQENRAVNCRISKDNLANITSSPRTLVKDDNGQYRRLTEDERQQRISEIQNQIKELCDS